MSTFPLVLSGALLFLAIKRSASLAPPLQIWRPLPHVNFNVKNLEEGSAAVVAGGGIERREALATGAGVLASGVLLATSKASAASFDPLTSPRSVVSLESHGSIPVWPSWAGGRVIPISLGGALQDPFLLLAHHDHWFDPRDPLREPFKVFGKTLGLPYVDVEGFQMHPHRGFDIWTYVLDGSDGFRHRDSLGSNPRTYRGGTAQWMRTGSGVMHEEFWETNPDKRTNIELFQLWVNLPATHKFDPPAIRYLGQETGSQWMEQDIIHEDANDVASSKGKVVGTVRNLGATLDQAIGSSSLSSLEKDTLPIESDKDTIGDARQRPPVDIMHATIDPGGRWTIKAPLEHSALIYVRKGSAFLRGIAGDKVLATAQQTATFGHNGGTITVENAATTNNKRDAKSLDILVLMAKPLQESVVQAGPIVMNSAGEVNDAYQQLEDGSFLDRDHALQQQKARTMSSRFRG